MYSQFVVCRKYMCNVTCQAERCLTCPLKPISDILRPPRSPQKCDEVF